MQKRLLLPHEKAFPNSFNHLLAGADLYDSSSSEQARVYFIDKAQGYFLKKATRGSLQKEADLTRYFHQKGWAQEVLDYFSDDHDWLLTAKVYGEDASSDQYLADPKKLCQVLAESMHKLHKLDAKDCLVNHTTSYLQAVDQGYEQERFDPFYLLPSLANLSKEEAYGLAKEVGQVLQTATPIHGDFCLPNLILDNWKVQAMIDWDSAGLGDRHIDLFWLRWSLNYNLKTDQYWDYALDCYGRNNINLDLLEAISACETFG